MKKVELYRSLSQFDLEDTDLFIEFANDHRKRLLELQDAADTVHAEAAGVELPEALVKRVSRFGPATQPNSAVGLLKTFIAGKERFSSQEYRAFLKEKRPDIGPTSGYQALYALAKQNVIDKVNSDIYVVTKQSETN